MSSSSRSVAIVGGGPAGLRAAERAIEAGARVTVYDHKPSVGRKFLIAGKSGLNLTNDAGFDDFLAQYSGAQFPLDRWRTYLSGFDRDAMRAWARGLGVETFVAGGGKVFPTSKKAAPLLRRWLSRLKVAGVQFEMHHRWLGLERVGDRIELLFRNRDGDMAVQHDAVVLALGASWPQTGSDGAWTAILRQLGVDMVPLQGANCGWECLWTPETLAVAEGQPLHHLSIQAGDQRVQGELMVTRYGFEGSPLYRLGPQLRRMKEPELIIDFKPVFSEAHMIAKMESARRHFYKEARLRWKFTDAMCAILRQQYGEFESAEALAAAAKCCRIPLLGPRPVAEAISTAGGVAWTALNEDLMLQAIPGVYCAGEMIDWEAPTGGFLLQGCFATGTVAGAAAAGVSVHCRGSAE